MEQQQILNGLPLVTSALGEQRTPTRFYPDGSYDCPFCHYAIRADEGLGPCKNPWCIAHPLCSPEAARKMLADVEAKRLAEEERKRNHEQAMARIREWKETEDRERTAKLTQAREQGYCIKCLVRSGYRKQVRHRKLCPLN